MLDNEYQISPLRDWFLDKAPTEALKSLRKDFNAFLQSPDYFMSVIYDETVLASLNENMDKLHKFLVNVLERIVEFINRNEDLEDGLSPFEYIIMSKKTLYEESYDFFYGVYSFIADIQAISTNVKAYNSEEAYADFVNKVKPQIAKICAKREQISDYIDDNIEFLSDCISVDEANEKYSVLTQDETDYILDENSYDSFLKNGKNLIDLITEKQKSSAL